MTQVLDLLADWLPRQRWYASGATPAQLRLLGSFEFTATGDDDVRLITVALVHDDATDATYQVPLVVRAVDAEVPALGFIGPVQEDGARAALVDGAHDPVFVRALLDAIADEQELHGDGVRAYGQPMPGASVGEFVTSRVLTGEQSNTSIICELRGQKSNAVPPLIMKLFRRLHDGDNPDVTLQTAIAAAGSLRVPPAFGALTGAWRDAHGERSGHLAFGAEYFTGVEDAWRVALRACERDADFGELAHSLGEATAEVHAVLRRAMPTVEATDADIDTAVKQMQHRLQLATEAVPQLRDYAEAAEGVYAALRRATWPTLQRIHGDYHLGQVLAVPGRGWVLLDFEGEPLRPLSERNAPDVPHRDVAGMLRSFDYVAGALTLREGDDRGTAWATAAREAFLAGYDDWNAANEPAAAIAGPEADDSGAVRAPAVDDAQLRRAYELDKAVYETLYEAQHRPEWLGIPVRAVARLVAGE